MADPGAGGGRYERNSGVAYGEESEDGPVCVCMPVCMPAYLAKSLPIWPPARLPAYLATCLPICPPARLSGHVPAHLPAHPPVYFMIHNKKLSGASI